MKSRQGTNLVVVDLACEKPCWVGINLCMKWCNMWSGNIRKRILENFDMYMSYRWRESFNTVRFVTSSQRGLTCVGAECGKEGGWNIHPSRRWLIGCAQTAVLYVCLSIALTSCTTSMAENNPDAIRKQKNAEYSKRYQLKRKMKMQQQVPTTSEAEPEKLQV